MKIYRKRIFDGILREALESKGVVLVQGPKWCGKTTTAEQIAQSVLYMDDPLTAAQNRQAAETQPMHLLEGANPRLIGLSRVVDAVAS